MADYLVDTTVFIDYRRGVAGAVDFVQRLRAKTVSASFSPITVAELWQGQMKTRAEVLRYALLLGTMEEASLGLRQALRAGAWLRNITNEEKRRLFADALIAATAESRGEVLYTRDADMSRFYDKVESY